MKIKLFCTALVITSYFAHIQAQFWTSLGPDDNKQASMQGVASLSIATGSAGDLYIAYSDELYDYKATVRKWNTSAWENVGTQGFSSGRTGQIKLVIAPDGSPVVAYTDETYDSRVTVQKWNEGTNTWETVGTEQISAGMVNYLNLAIDPYGVPYVAYNDAENSHIATVKKWDGSDWINVGTGNISTGLAAQICLCFDLIGIPYLAYSPGGEGAGVVKKWNEGKNAWEDVGTEGFSSGNAYFISLNFNSSNEPYVAYSDGENQKKVTVKKWDGSTWASLNSSNLNPGQASDITLGIDRSGSSDIFYLSYIILQGVEPEFTYKAYMEKWDGSAWADLGDLVLSEYSVDLFSLNIGPSGIPFIAYRDELLNNQAIVKQWDGRSWLDIGTTGFSRGLASYISLVNTSDNTTYIGYSEGIKGKATVQKWNGNAWEVLGIHGFSEGRADMCSLGIDENGNPVLAYSDGGTDGVDGKVTVKKWNGSVWSVLGNRGFSTGMAYSISLAVDPAGTPYVAYSDNNLDGKAVVKKWNESANTWENVGTEGFSPGKVYSISLAIDQSGVPYISYSDATIGSIAYVKKWEENSNEWIDVGMPVSTNYTSFNTLAFDPSGTLFIAYKDGANHNGPTVKKWFQDEWITVGKEGFSWRLAQYISLAFSPAGTPYISYLDFEGIGYIEAWDGTSWDDITSERYSRGFVKYPDISITSSGELIIAYSTPGAFAKKADIEIQMMTITCPEDVTVQCDESIDPEITGYATVTGSCSDLEINYSDSEIEGSCENEKTITRTWTATDACGNSTSANQMIIIVDTEAPSITVPDNVTLECPADVSPEAIGSATATDDCWETTISYADVLIAGCGNTETITRTWTATDACGNSTSANQMITVLDNIAPTISGIPSGPIEKGNDPGQCGAIINYPVISATDNCGGDIGITVQPESGTLFDVGSTTVYVYATDACGNIAVESFEVIVTNEIPDIISITSALDPLPIFTPINATGMSSDNNLVSAVWEWGDGSISDGGLGTDILGEHTYNEPGVYTVVLTVTDACGEIASFTYQYVVVYDPDGGFVTGGGWINSPFGSYTAVPSLVGKANFGFVAKYKKGEIVPDGNTEFQFKAGDLNFNSYSYDWLVIAGDKAKYKGEGTINGSGAYGFMLSAVDGDLKDQGEDRFRIKIWDKDDGDALIYDNQIGDADDADAANIIGGGSIVIHTKDMKKAATLIEPESKIHIYPNPFDNSIYIDLFTESTHEIIIDMVDMNGRVLEYLFTGIIAAEVEHRFDLNTKAELTPGSYILRIRTKNGELLGREIIIKR